MRKIEQKMLAAVNARRDFELANTRVQVYGDSVRVFLWGESDIRPQGQSGFLQYGGLEYPNDVVASLCARCYAQEPSDESERVV